MNKVCLKLCAWKTLAIVGYFRSRSLGHSLLETTEGRTITFGNDLSLCLLFFNNSLYILSNIYCHLGRINVTEIEFVSSVNAGRMMYPYTARISTIETEELLVTDEIEGPFYA